MHESAANEELEKRKLDRALKTTHEMKKRMKFEKNRVHMFCPVTRDDLLDLLTSISNSFQAFASGDFRYQPRSGSSRVVMIMLAFLGLITSSHYTANVTANSVVRAVNRRASISTIEEGIREGYRFCGWPVLQPILEENIPGMRGRYESMSGSATIAAMDDGSCDAAIIETHTWLAAAHRNVSHCNNKALLPETVWTVDIAFAVREDLQRSLSMAMMKAKEKGTWTEIHAAAQTRFLAPDVCDVADSSAQAATESSTLDILDGAGILIWAVAITTVALLANMLWYASPAAKAERARQRDWLKEYENQGGERQTTSAEQGLAEASLSQSCKSSSIEKVSV